MFLLHNKRFEVTRVRALQACRYVLLEIIKGQAKL